MSVFFTDEDKAWLKQWAADTTAGLRAALDEGIDRLSLAESQAIDRAAGELSNIVKAAGLGVQATVDKALADVHNMESRFDGATVSAVVTLPKGQSQ